MLRVGDEFSMLKRMLRSDEWPLATTRICEDEYKRSSEILEHYIETDVSGSKFLGNESQVVELAAKKADVAIGFDSKHVRDHSPYDIILLYDIVDHVESPAKTMEKVKSLCHSETKVFVRCHPWSGRHGGHQYRQINKAFLHLVFNKREIERLGIQLGRNLCNMSPQNTYRNLFRNAGFRQRYIQVVEESIEPFFQDNKIINRRIMERSKETSQYSGRLYFPRYQMSQSFVDFVLQLK